MHAMRIATRDSSSTQNSVIGTTIQDGGTVLPVLLPVSPLSQSSTWNLVHGSTLIVPWEIRTSRYQNERKSTGRQKTASRMDRAPKESHKPLVCNF